MIETERCLIKPFEQSDFTDVKKLYVNHKVRKYLGGIRPEDAVEESLHGMLQSGDNSFYWVVKEKQSGDFIGLVSLDPHHEGDDLEISYQFLPEWWGAGYATEVVQKLIHYAFDELNLSRVIAETQTANTGSSRLLERAGMKRKKTIMRFGAEQAVYCIENFFMKE
ncbi:GNAT family N-acetyltransferase [Virgibacillus doumboii]|uniref:GNAT family N-acetyltransferase n=1 Tax=Virgibacillus doumboii TaxID=2697503 RepID=UPI0013E0AC7B|nr:GNAT family N-acetyltransferase [Virgibacillus doumboii]